MPNFMLVYKGETTDPSEMTDEQRDDIMGRWTVWMDNLGSSLVDVGMPLGPGTSVVDDGSTATAVPLSGYSIVEAVDMSEAQALVKDHPYLSDHTGDFAVDIYEMLPVPM